MVTLIKFDTGFNAGFYTGSGTSSSVPSLFPVALNGRPYALQWEKEAIGVWGAKYKHVSLPLLRGQADQSNTPGEQSISPENFWRRSQESWTLGSGQVQQDRATSQAARFNTSKGVNPWTPFQLSLLNDVSNVRASANTSLASVVCSSYVYLADGASLVFAQAPLSAWTTVTGTPNAAVSLCTDGAAIYSAHGASGVYSTAAGAASAASLATGTASLVAFVKGRLMVAGGTSIYNYTSGAALPAALLTKAAGFTWVGFAGGQNQIYAAGYSGDKSLIYRTAIQADGTALTAPIVAGELPDGEIVRSINAYLGYIIIGSDLGVRFCSVASTGELQIGALIPTTSPVYCSEGQDKFIWHGVTNYDSASTGLGRMDLTNFVSPLTPAYASDLMATGQGAVKSVHTFANSRIFTVDGLGLYQESLNTPVASGSLVTGWIGYGISDPKVAVFVDLKHDPLNGTIAVSLTADGGSAVTLGTSGTAGSAAPPQAFQANQVAGLQFRLTLTLTPAANVSPKLTRWTLRSYPAPVRSSEFEVPILLFPTVKTNIDTDYNLNVSRERQLLKALHKSQQVFSFQEGNDTYNVVMYDYQWLPEKITPTGDMSGTFLAQLHEITG
jgi:hypothetical protein